MLFCKYVKDRATVKELFKVIDAYVTNPGLKEQDCVGIGTDGAQTMAQKHSGLQALIQKGSLPMQNGKPDNPQTSTGVNAAKC